MAATDYEYGKRYDVEPGKAANLIQDMTEGRIGEQTLRLWDQEGRPGFVVLEAVDPQRNVLTFSYRYEGREGIARDFPGDRISGVALIDTEPPLDRSDEVRG